MIREKKSIRSCIHTFHIMECLLSCSILQLLKNLLFVEQRRTQCALVVGVCRDINTLLRLMFLFIFRFETRSNWLKEHKYKIFFSTLQNRLEFAVFYFNVYFLCVCFFLLFPWAFLSWSESSCFGNLHSVSKSPSGSTSSYNSNILLSGHMQPQFGIFKALGVSVVVFR